MVKVLFVCWGNICRSPMCEFVFRDIIKKAGREREFMAESAATSDEEIWNGIGNPVYPPAAAKLSEAGIDCSGKRARLMQKSDYDRYDLLVGMEDLNLRYMKKICGGDPDHKIVRLMDFTDRPGNVSDPWYTRDFDTCWKDVEEGCTGLWNYLIKKTGPIL